VEHGSLDVTTSICLESGARGEVELDEQYSQDMSPSHALQSRENRMPMAAADVNRIRPRRCRTWGSWNLWRTMGRDG
jgi:hypothetical protein